MDNREVTIQGDVYSPKKILNVTTAKASDNRYLEVKDNDMGKDIPSEIREQIFEPFFTSKQVGQGVGLSLSVSYSIILGSQRGN